MKQTYEVRKSFDTNTQMAAPFDLIIPAATAAQLTRGNGENRRFRRAFIQHLATAGIGWQDGENEEEGFVINGEAVDYFFLNDGTIGIYGHGGRAQILDNAIQAYIGAGGDEDPQPPSGGRKKKRKTRGKKRTSRHRLTRRR